MMNLIQGILLNIISALTNDSFTMEQMQRYISFARTFNPIIPEDAKAKLTECYKALRRNDNSPNSQQSYRITIRQLESLIRLSEALARVHLDEYVKPHYVEEAFRLLKQSVIKVETKDIELEETYNSNVEQDNQDGITINLNEYCRIGNMISYYIKDMENGIKWGDLVRWYIEQEGRSENIEFQQKFINLIIRHLINPDKVLIYLNSEDPSIY